MTDEQTQNAKHAEDFNSLPEHEQKRCRITFEIYNGIAIGMNFFPYRDYEVFTKAWAESYYFKCVI